MLAGPAGRGRQRLKHALVGGIAKEVERDLPLAGDDIYFVLSPSTSPEALQ